MTAATLKRLERDAMRWYQLRKSPLGVGLLTRDPALQYLYRACAAHANAQRKGAKGKRK